MIWHSQKKSINGKVRHVADSKAWAHIEATWPDFASNPRNVRLALPLMGSTPLGTWSTWPALLLNYNLPPWLVTKRFFMILCLIIPGPQNMKMGNFDVYLAPALEELQDLWNGVKAMDVLAPPESREFTLKAMLGYGPYPN